MHQLARRGIKTREVVEHLAQVQLAFGELAVAVCVVAVGDADADVEDPVTARKDPAITGAERPVPHHFELVDAADHRVVLHITPQCHAAGCVALGHAGGQQRLRHCAGGEHQPAGAQLACVLAVVQARTDDHAVRFERCDKPNRREHARTRCHRRAADDVVELLARQHGQHTRHIDAPAARCDAADVAGGLRHGHHRVEHTELAQRVVGVGNQAVAADLVAWKGLAVDQHDGQTGARQRQRRGATGRAGADDEHIATFGKGFDAEVHGELAVCGHSRERCVGVGKVPQHA